jgi:hypothetical protein
MYQTCLHCQRPLGANEAIENLPIGRRIAFDGHRGRLWVVCRRCGRWNLVPFESRWEALEECERAFERATQRASTDQIALARLGEGLDLVRIGKPPSPEFAAWRYGQVLQARRRRYLVYTAAGTAAAFAFLGGVTWFGVLAGVAGSSLMINAPNFWMEYHRRWRRALTVRTPDGQPRGITKSQLEEAELLVGEDGLPGVSLRLRRKQELVLTGPAARHALPGVLAAVNEAGAKESEVQDALSMLQLSGGPEAYLAKSERLIPAWKHDGRRQISYLLEVDRLALEMALHEESERRALEGELELLLEAWREAEELAGIADRLALPAPVVEKLEALKGEAQQKS